MSTAEQAQPTAPAPPTASTAPPMFRFSEIVDLPDERVYIRLPNQFQHQDLAVIARAAQARRIRQLRDPLTDAYVVLDSDMDDLLREGKTEDLVEEIVGRDWWRDHLEAIRDIQGTDEFASIEEDMERLEAVMGKPEHERDADEAGELERHVEAYNDAVDAARTERQRPRREALGQRTVDDLVADIRESRIVAEGKQAFNRAFSVQEMAVGTYHFEIHADGKPHPTSRYFANTEAVESADPGVLTALSSAFSGLEAQFQRGAVGNG